MSSNITVNGKSYTYDVERTPVIAWAVTTEQSERRSDGSYDINTTAVPIFEGSGNIDGLVGQLKILPGSGAVSIDAIVTAAGSDESRCFTLGIERPGARLDVRGEVFIEIQRWQQEAKKRSRP
jgi:hypothetical protein